MGCESDHFHLNSALYSSICKLILYKRLYGFLEYTIKSTERKGITTLRI